MNRKNFYDELRKSGMNLTTQNVIGMEKLLDYSEAEKKEISTLPYVLATAWWETAQTMHPVKEAYWKTEAWRKKNLRYFPWYGRGLIQTTWKKNYEKIWKLLKRPLPVDPDAFLTWDIAIPALFLGMEKGLYTGKDLDDFIDNIDESDSEDLREYVNARRIVNGTDKAVSIGKIALICERALKKGNYGKGEMR